MTPTPTSWPRWLLAILEILTALLTAAGLVVLCLRVDTNPLDRIGQVSGLAGVQFRFALLAVAVIAATALVGWRLKGSWFGGGLRSALTREPVARELTLRLVCAATAGLAGGVPAGGLAVALHGTPWGLNGKLGDTGRIIDWATAAMAGKGAPPTYPPLPIYALGWLAKLTGQPIEYAMKPFQIILIAAIGPFAYLAWRLLLTPVWALVVGVTSALPLIDAYKAYVNIVLVVLVPLLIKAVAELRTAGDRNYPQAMVIGALLGLGLGVLFLSYFGWFLWSTIGLLAAILIFFPWRSRAGSLRALVLLAVTFGVFFGIAHKSLIDLLTKGNGEKDTYFYFDVETRPTYFAHWFDDRPPLKLGVWPPPGGLGGVDMFTVLLFVGLGVALLLGYRRTDVVLIATLVVGAWLIRMWLAQRMYATQNVQLYPRTNVQILYGLLLATGLALMLAVRSGSRSGTLYAVRTHPGALLGVLAGAMFLFASMGDAIADDYMPKNDTSNGGLAWHAHTTPLLDGTCSKYTKHSGTSCVVVKVWTYVSPTPVPTPTVTVTVTPTPTATHTTSSTPTGSTTSPSNPSSTTEPTTPGIPTPTSSAFPNQ